MRLKLHATPQEVMRAVAALREFGEAKHIPEKILFGLTLALEESASNVVNHALRRDPSQTFQLHVEQNEDTVTMELRDQGPAFDPTKAALPAPGAIEQEHPVGGWGIQLMRRYIDQLQYRREGEENVLRLSKRLGPESGETTISERNQTPEHSTPESTS